MKASRFLSKIFLFLTFIIVSFNINASDIKFHPTDVKTSKNPQWFYCQNQSLIPFAPQFNTNNQSKAMSMLKLAGVYNLQGYIGDTAMVVFMPGATAGFDAGYDATKMMNNDPNMPNLYTVINGSVFASINVYPELDTVMVTIPIGYSGKATVQHKISAPLIDNFPPGTAIYLQDVQQSVMQDLTINPNYYFNVQTGDLETGRFFIIFDAPNIVGINENVNNSKNIFNAWYYNKKIHLTFFNDINKNAVVDVIDVFGRVVVPQSVVNVGNHQFDFVDKNSGYYFLRFNCDGKTNIKKFFVD